MENVKRILIDVDGVLTDGKVWYNQFGERSKGFHTRDIRSLRELVGHGFELYLITASTWPGLKDYSKRTGTVIVMDREKICEQFDEYIAVGDDISDINMLKKATQAFCPCNADPLIKRLEGIHVLACAGGEGVIAELANILIKRPFLSTLEPQHTPR